MGFSVCYIYCGTLLAVSWSPELPLIESIPSDTGLIIICRSCIGNTITVYTYEGKYNDCM